MVNQKQTKRKTLRCYSVSESVFDDIVQLMASRIRVVDNIEKYYTGYPEKHLIMYDNKEVLIIREHLLAHFSNFTEEDYQLVEDWRQVIVRKNHTQEQDYLRSIDGSRAYKVMKEIICKYYSEKEYDERLNSFTAEYDAGEAQFHFQYPSTPDVVLAHSNCFKYDINGAHHDALIEIFPKAAQELRDMFARRKEEPLLKAYINYYVGMLTRKGYRKTYNWIVQRVSKQLKSAINTVGGDLVYANTDGFMVSNPEQRLKHSKNLGEFKLEFEGTAYTYQDKNYWCFQAGNEITGSIRYQARDLVDLKNGKVVHYKIDRKVNSSGVIEQKLTSIQEELVNVYKES